MRRIATQDIEKGKPVGYYYGTIVSCRTEVLLIENVLREGLMPVTKYEFQSKAISVGQKVKYSAGHTFNVWLLRAKFSCMRFINNPRSNPGKDKSISAVMHLTRSFNVTFEEPFTL